MAAIPAAVPTATASVGRDVEGDHREHRQSDAEEDRREDGPAAKSAAEADRVAERLGGDQDEEDLAESSATRAVIEYWPEKRTSCEFAPSASARPQAGRRPTRRRAGAAPFPTAARFRPCAVRGGARPRTGSRSRSRRRWRAAGRGRWCRRRSADPGRERCLLEPAPVAQPDEEQVADCRRDQAGEENRDQQRAHADARLDEEQACHERPAEKGRDGREGARHREHAVLLPVDGHDVRDGEADDRAERDQGRLRAEHGAEGQRPESSQRDARRVGDRRRLGADPV